MNTVVVYNDNNAYADILACYKSMERTHDYTVMEVDNETMCILKLKYNCQQWLSESKTYFIL